MAQRFPVGTVRTEPAAFCIPAGVYRVTLPRLEESTTKDGSKLKYITNIGFQVVEGDHAGTALFNYPITFHDMIIGPIDADGQVADPEDWKGRGGVLLNNMWVSAGVDVTEDPDANNEAAEGREVMMQIRVEKDASGDYLDKNRIVRFYPVPDAKPAAKPTGAAGAARPTVPASRPGQVSAPSVASATPKAAANGPAPKPTTPAAGPKASENYICPECQPRNDIPRRFFGRHLAIHESYKGKPDEPTWIPVDANEEWTPAG